MFRTGLGNLRVPQWLRVRACSTSVGKDMSVDNKDVHPVRVRYAPSPTGSLHLGGLRTALYNYLFAKQQGGANLLRIEDTDRTRLVESAMSQQHADLSWGNITFDEGPSPLPGKYGPYIQSERLPIYQEYVTKLLECGHAYRCFCSSERLDVLRTSQSSKGQSTMYDRLCSTLTKDETTKKMQNKEPYVIRMKVPEGETVVKDLIRGDVVFQNKLVDDQVLMKTDGFPTYHLANVVDDHLMHISHVIRGEEWLPSAPKHVLLYQMFNWKAPQFAHLPLLLREDGAKLSKRFKDASMNYYIEQGYLPEALINFVLLLGWHPSELHMQNTNSASPTPSTTKTELELLKESLLDEKTRKKITQQETHTSEVFTMEQAIQIFDITRVQKSGAAVEQAKLNYFQAQHWKMALDGNITRLINMLLPHIHAFLTRIETNTLNDLDKEHIHIAYTGLHTDIRTVTDPSQLQQVLTPILRTTRDHPCKLTTFMHQTIFAWVKPDITSENAVAMKNTFWVDENNMKTTTQKTTKQVLQLCQTFLNEKFTSDMCANHQTDIIVKEFKQFVKTHKISLKELYLPLRFVLSATTEGPGVADQICALGLKETTQRIQHCIDTY